MPAEPKQQKTTTYMEDSLLWARESRLTLTTDTDLDRDGKRVYLAMMRPWKQDKEKPYMWIAFHENLDDAVCECINRVCGKNQHQALDFGYRPWNKSGDVEGSPFRKPPVR